MRHERGLNNDLSTTIRRFIKIYTRVFYDPEVNELQNVGSVDTINTVDTFPKTMLVGWHDTR